jgi:aryl-alcohol dehydrogenase-like predicted oxidoreductase/enamine deaminase RidA (YjgF/YER057c/UK114 family)
VATSPTVERCELAPGLSISRVLTGLWQVADLERGGRGLDQDEAALALAPYVAAGFTAFDMADHYGSAEEIAGRLARGQGPGGPVQLLTKWVPKPGPLTREDVQAAVRRALDRLRVDTIDLLQLHAWNYADPSWLDALLWLQELRHEGLIRHLGLTNFDAAHLRIVIASGIPVVSNQVCFSLLDARPRGGLRDLCLKHGVRLLAYGTVAGGFLTERWLGKAEPDWARLDTWSELKYGRFIQAAGGWEAFQGLLRSISAVAQKHGVSMANVACRSVLDEPAVAGIIVGARLGKSEHIEDNRRVFGLSLDESDREEIEAARATLRPIPGDSGDEYRKPPFLTASGDLSHHLESLPPPYTVKTGPDGRSFVLSGTEWEKVAGFCRAVRRGDHVFVSGTTATHRDRAVGGSDVAAQLHFVVDKIEGALQSLGARLDDVVRTRVFVRRLSDWEAAARAHGERFRAILPANTLVQAGLVGDEYLVEMEAEAVAGPPKG